jgi:tetratricopeptide (TPR) repeat protein
MSLLESVLIISLMRLGMMRLIIELLQAIDIGVAMTTIQDIEQKISNWVYTGYSAESLDQHELANTAYEKCIEMISQKQDGDEIIVIHIKSSRINLITGNIFAAERTIRSSFNFVLRNTDGLFGSKWRDFYSMPILSNILSVRSPDIHENLIIDVWLRIFSDATSQFTPNNPRSEYAGKRDLIIRNLSGTISALISRENWGDIQRLVEWADMFSPTSLRSAEHEVLIHRIRGMVCAARGEINQAGTLLEDAVRGAREKDFAYEEAAARAELARLRCREARFEEARDILEEVWSLAERNSYRLLHADARNLLAQIEQAEGHDAEAAAAAIQAYRLAWCDGPPYAYQAGLEQAQEHLAALGLTPPDDLPPFDPSAHEPLPEIVIEGPDGPIRI